MAEKEDRILVVRVGAMGDVLHAMPAVAALRKAHPAAEIGWVVDPRWESLLGPELVDRIHLAPTKAWNKKPFSLQTLQDILRLRRELRAVKYSVSVDLQGSFRSAVIARMSGAERRVGRNVPRETIARRFYSERVDTVSAHVIDQAVEIMRVAAKDPSLQAEPVTFPLDANAERWCESLLRDDSKPLAVVAPSAGWGAKQWPAERYGAVAAALAEHGVRVLVNAVPTTEEHGGDLLAAAVVTASNGYAEAVECSLPQLTALLRRASLLVGGDTGPLHLAAAMDVPVVAVFGPTDPKRTGPYGVRSVVLRDASSVTDHGRYKDAEAGLLKISVESVVRAATRLLEGREGE
jgi:heptosyltransferase-1